MTIDDGYGYEDWKSSFMELMSSSRHATLWEEACMCEGL